jgi:hypothetical protein
MGGTGSGSRHDGQAQSAEPGEGSERNGLPQRLNLRTTPADTVAALLDQVRRGGRVTARLPGNFTRSGPS